MPLLRQNNKDERMSQIVITALTKYLRNYSFLSTFDNIILNF